MSFPENDTSEAEVVETGAEGADAAGAAGQDGAGSSVAQAQTEDEGLLSVVRDAVKEKAPEPAAASPAEGVETGDKPDENAPKKQDDEEYSDVPFNKHPRFRALLRERNEFKADAGKFRQVDTFIRDNGMTAQEAADLLTVGALAKTNPAKAWELAKPWVEKVLEAAGEVLPPELQQMVRDGTMTQEAAFEVSRARASVASTQATRSFEQRQAEQRAEADHEKAMHDASTAWAEQRRERDPNFETKIEPMKRELAWRLMQGEVPKTPQEAREQLDDIYKVVNASLAPPAPPPAANSQQPAAARPPVKPIMGGSVAGNARPKPGNMLDVVKQAVGAG